MGNSASILREKGKLDTPGKYSYTLAYNLTWQWPWPLDDLELVHDFDLINGLDTYNGIQVTELTLSTCDIDLDSVTLVLKLDIVWALDWNLK